MVALLNLYRRNLMKKHVILAMMAVLSFLIGNHAFGQVSPLGSGATAVYEWSNDANFGQSRETFVWRNSVDLTAKLGKRADGYEIYALNDFSLVFDPVSMASSYSSQIDVNLGVSLSGTNKRTFVVGDTWTTSFSTPQQPGSRCISGASLKYDFKSSNPQTTKVLIDGVAVDVQTVTITGDGYWNSCGASGKGVRTIVYSTTLGAVISEEQVAIYNGNIGAGRKISVKEFHRNIPASNK